MADESNPADPLHDELLDAGLLPIGEFLAQPENAHLRDDASYVVCSACGRKSWGGGPAGSECGMTQPSGLPCRGVFGLPEVPSA